MMHYEVGNRKHGDSQNAVPSSGNAGCLAALKALQGFTGVYGGFRQPAGLVELKMCPNSQMVDRLDLQMEYLFSGSNGRSWSLDSLT